MPSIHIVPFTALRFGPLPERVLALYTHQILEGVAFLHLNRVIHRDLKGNNVMLMPTGVIKLIDFGCARRLSCPNHTASNSGDLLKSVHGTPYWMAPEVDKGLFRSIFSSPTMTHIQLLNFILFQWFTEFKMMVLNNSDRCYLVHLLGYK